MNIQYRDKEWLQTKYLTEELSTYKIAEICHVDDECIRKWMIRFEIPRRKAYIANYCKFNEDLNNLITGSMLGDGSLSWGYETVSAYYSLSSKYKKYLQYVKSVFEDISNIKTRGSIAKYTNDLGTWYVWQTGYYRGWFPDLRRLWYPGNKKIIPNNIKLTPECLRTFYIEDGCLGINWKIQRIEYVSLAVNNFTFDDIAKLIQMMALELNIPFNDIKINKSCKPNQYNIVINKRAAIRAFFDYIGSCPSKIISCFGYKWPVITEDEITYNFRSFKNG
jgi:hypothetical protein